MRLVLLTAAALALAAPLAPLANAAPDGADLAVKLYGGPSPRDDGLVRLGGYVHNQGGAPSGPFTLRLDVDGVVVMETRLASLPAGGEAWWTVYHERGGLVTFAADVLDEVAEADESNNVATVLAVPRDLAVSIQLAPVPGKLLTHRVDVTACNLEGGPADRAVLSVDLRQATPARARAVAQETLALAEGACVARSYLVETPGVGSFEATAWLADGWDPAPRNNVARAEGHAVADPGVGAISPVAGPDV